LPDELAELQSAGISLALIQGDVCDRSSLADALEAIPESFPPIRGVIHAAGVLDDGPVPKMDLHQLRTAMAPKTRGAWNLHERLPKRLDFFVLFSSVAGTIGSPGQANYAAGNAFLDGLAQLRRRSGQPAASIAWGPWSGEGMASRGEVRRQLRDRGIRPLAAETAFRILERVIQRQPPTLAVMDVDWGVMLAKLPGRGSSLLAALRPDEPTGPGELGAGATDQQLRKRLQAATPADRLDQLAQIIAGAVGKVMGIDPESIEVDQPLATLGLDSLMGMELRSNLEAKLGIEIPMASLFDEPSVTTLSRVAAEALGDEVSEEPSEAAMPGEETAKPVQMTKPKSALVALGGSRGEDSPLFCLHPIGGDLRCYDGMARAMGNRPVYGLRAAGLQPGTRAHRSIDAMVTDYIATIREAQPRGPYCLTGWSTGGIFAYEVGRRMETEGIPVQAIVMIDTPLPAVFEQVDLGDDAKFLVDLVEFANYFAGTSMEIRYEALKGKSEQEAISNVLALAIEHGVLPANTTHESLHRLIEVCKQHVRILQSYWPPKSDLRVHLLRPEDTSMLTEATRQSHAEDLGWSQFVPLQRIEVPGHHFTMMTGSNAASLAKTIDELLAEPALVDSTARRTTSTTKPIGDR
jgi:myxalamid-type polyketide synthase MxaB